MIRIIRSTKKQPSYAVGYGKPPESTQFKPGQSGNPKGRRKGQPGLTEIVVTEAARLVKVQVGSKTHHLPKKQVLIRRVYELGLRGNLKAAQMALNLLAAGEAAGGLSPAFEPPLSDAELAILEEWTPLSKK